MSRDHIVSIRLTDEERARLGRLAAAAGRTPSEYVRRAALPPPAAPAPNSYTSGVAPGHCVVTPAPLSAGTPGVVWEDGTVGPTWHGWGLGVSGEAA